MPLTAWLCEYSLSNRNEERRGEKNRMVELACTNITEVMWLCTLRSFVTFCSERSKWECVKVGLWFVSFVVILTEYFRTQNCANYKHDADRTEPLNYIKRVSRSRQQYFYYLLSWSTFALCATHWRTWRNRNRLFWVAL